MTCYGVDNRDMSWYNPWHVIICNNLDMSKNHPCHDNDIILDMSRCGHPWHVMIYSVTQEGDHSHWSIPEANLYISLPDGVIVNLQVSYGSYWGHLTDVIEDSWGRYWGQLTDVIEDSWRTLLRTTDGRYWGQLTDVNWSYQGFYFLLVKDFICTCQGY